MKRKLLIIELNEFNVELLENYADKFGLKNIRRLLKMPRNNTSCDELKEHHGLDPWVQWVSIHTGKPLRTHGIVRNNDVENLKYKQFWEILSEKGISSGIWGAMNAKRNKSNLCHFFLPDPWNYSEKAYPKNLDNFLYLPRYYSRNYTNFSKIKIIRGLLKLLKFFIYPPLILRLTKNFYKIFRFIITDGFNNNNLFVLFDLILSEVFIYYKKIFKPDVSIIFMNSLAHFQHHYWDPDKLNQKGKICLENIDFILGKLLREIDKKEPLIIFNGMSQKNVKNEGYCIYKLKNAKKFLNDLNIKFIDIEESMTNDGKIKFHCIEDLKKAKNTIDNIFIKNKKIFFTENISSKRNFTLFWQLDFYEKILEDCYFSVFNKNFMFYKYFILLAERSGSHIPEGEIIHRHFNLPKKIDNNQFFDYILAHFE